MFEIIYNNIIVKSQYLTPTQTKNQPLVSGFEQTNNNYYTLIMYDPDTKHGDYVHWLIINIKNNINDGNILIPYKGPAPPINTGIHRYIFLLFKQDNLINKNNLLNIDRIFNIKDLLNKIGLNIEPINKVFFTSSYQTQIQIAGKYKVRTRKHKIQKNKAKKKSKRRKNKTRKLLNKSYNY